jgi:hypothetical protein
MAVGDSSRESARGDACARCSARRVGRARESATLRVALAPTSAGAPEERAVGRPWARCHEPPLKLPSQRGSGRVCCGMQVALLEPVRQRRASQVAVVTPAQLERSPVNRRSWPRFAIAATGHPEGARFSEQDGYASAWQSATWRKWSCSAFFLSFRGVAELCPGGTSTAMCASASTLEP